MNPKYIIVANGNNEYTVMEKQTIGWEAMHHCTGEDNAWKYAENKLKENEK